MAVSIGEIEATLRLRDELSAQLKSVKPLVQDATKALGAMESGVQDVGTEFKRVEPEIKKAGAALDDVEKSGGKLNLSMVALGTAIGFAIGTVALKAVSAFATAVTDMVKRGAEVAPISAAFDRLTASIGQSGDEMLRVTRTATKGLIADFDLMQATNKAILLGLPVTAQEMGDLAKTATTLGRAMGQGATKSFDDLIVALGRTSPMILDNLGLSVKVGEANEKYAASIGKVADQLTDAEKKTAFYNAAMEAARAKVAELGEVQLTAADHLQKMRVSWTNFTDALGVAIVTSPQINEVFKTLADAINEAVGDDQVSLVHRLSGAIGEMAIFLVSAMRQMVEFRMQSLEVLAFLDKWSPKGIVFGQEQVIQDRIAETKSVADGLERLEARLISMRGQQAATADVTAALARGTETLGVNIAGTSEEAKKAADAFKLWADQVTGRKLAAEVAQLETRLQAIGGVAAMTAHEWMAMGKQLQTMRDQGAQLPPVLEEMRRAYQLLAFQQDIGIGTNEMFVASIQRTTNQIRMSVADMTAALNAKILDPNNFMHALDPSMLPGKLLQFPEVTLPPGYGNKIGETIARAAAGGGNIGNALGAQIGNDLGVKLADKAGASLSKLFGKTVGGVIAGSLPGIGALLGPLAGKLAGAFAGLFTGGEGARANDLRDALKKQLADALKGLENDPTLMAGLNAFNTAGSQQGVQTAFDATMAAVNRTKDAMQKYGLSIDDIGDKSAKMRRTLSTVIDEFAALRRAGFSVEQVARGGASALNDLIGSALETGQMLPASLQPFIHELVRSGGLTDELKRKILGVADPVPWQAMEEAANRYGIALDDLGQKFQQAKLDDAAAQLAKDWALLAENGANIGAVMAGMKDEVQELISKALTLGLTIPEAMKPLIEAMFEAGQLVDENGDALEDLSRINWAPDVLSDFDLLIDKISELIDALLDGLYPAIENIPSPNVGTGGGASSGGGSGSAPNPQYNEDGTDRAHTGGMVGSGRIRKHHRGTSRILPFPNMRHDEVPAILQTGEAVLNRQAAAAAGEPAIRAMNNGLMTGTGGGPVYSVVVNAQGSHFQDRASMDRLADKMLASITRAATKAVSR